MNKFTVEICMGQGDLFESWEFIVHARQSREFIRGQLEEHKEEFDDPTELLDYLHDEYGIEWQDYYFDISVQM